MQRLYFIDRHKPSMTTLRCTTPTQQHLSSTPSPSSSSSCNATASPRASCSPTAGWYTTTSTRPGNASSSSACVPLRRPWCDWSLELLWRSLATRRILHKRRIRSQERSLHIRFRAIHARRKIGLIVGTSEGLRDGCLCVN